MKIENEIEKNVIVIRDKIREHFHSEFQNTDVSKLSIDLVETWNRVLAVSDKEITNVEELAFQVESCFKDLKNDIRINVNFLKDFNKDTNPSKDECFLLWKKYFFDTIDHLEKWMVFVNSAIRTLSNYEIQKDANQISNDWGVKRDEKSIAVEDFRKFLEKMKQHGGAGSEMDGFKPEEADLRLLNDALDFTANHKVKKLCEEDKLLVLGDFVKLSEVRKEMDGCSKGEVQVFAFNRVFFDDDIDRRGSKLKLSIIAPIWDIPTTVHKIILDGENGKDFDQKANDEQDGAPGLPGGQAGAFFGIGEAFWQHPGVTLSISTNGGKGGKGQEGGLSRGPTPNDDPNHYKDVYHCGDWPEPCPNHDGVPDNSQEGFPCYGYCPELDGDQASCNYWLLGKVREDPKSGGRGGEAGRNGSLEIIGGDFKINLSSKDGADGGDGKGGTGIPGDKVIVDCSRDGDKNEWKSHHDSNELEVTHGKDGGNENQRIPASESIRINEKADLIGNYKKYLRQNYGNRFKKNILARFHSHLDQHAQIKGLYKTLDLASELKGLEVQEFDRQLSKEDLVYFYNRLLEQISEYAKNPNESEKSDQYKKALGYLATTLLSRLHNLQTGTDSNLIIDINGYLDLVVQDMKILKDLQKDRDREKEQDNKVKVINKLKQNYKEGIDMKMQEATELIEKEILPQLDVITAKQDQQLDKLIKEILKLERDARRDEQALERKREEMKRAMMVRAILGAFGFLSKVVGAIFPPAGAAMGAIVDGANAISDGLSSGGSGNDIPKHLDEDIANLDKKMRIIKEKNTELLNKALDEILEELKKFEKDQKSDDLKEVSDKIANVKEKLKTNYNNREVQALIKELKQVLNMKRKELSPPKHARGLVKLAGGKSKYEAAKDLLDGADKKLKKVSDAVGSLADVFKHYNDDEKELKEIDRAIELEQEKIRKLRQFEDEIYDTIRPMLQNLANDLNETAKKLKTKSQVSLDIAKWKVQDSLRDMKLTMQQVSEGFEMSADMTRTIEKQEEAMTTLINVYDRIQNYQSDKKLANYIADISSAAAGRIIVGDKNLNDKINELEIVIRSNMVLNEYQSATNALKQWVFPFAEIYFSELKLPEQFAVEGNLDNLVAQAQQEIEKIKHKLLEYKTSIQHQDKYIHNSPFNSDYVSIRPFFVFKNANYSEMIRDLFSGKAVLVKADILNSDPDKDAIKFSLIDIKFKIADKTIQSELNEKLNGFKLSATHLGNSFYRCEKVYSIPSQSQTIEYSFEKDNKTGEPLDQNYVYKKLKQGDLMLSPYTMWKLKLLNSTSIPFADLDVFADKVDMELNGFGSYLAQEVDVKSLHIDSYYKADDTVKYERKSFVEMVKDYAANLYGRLVGRKAAKNAANNQGRQINAIPAGKLSNRYKMQADHLELEDINQTGLSTYLPIDTIGNLVLAQVAVGKLFGENKFLSNTTYLSMDQKIMLKHDEISRKILPALKMNFENETLFG